MVFGEDDLLLAGIEAKHGGPVNTVFVNSCGGCFALSNGLGAVG